VIPERVLVEVRRYLKYKRDERPVYVRIRCMDVLGLDKLRDRRPPDYSRSFVFVCFGNIMRSPMCEELMKRALLRYPAVKVSVASAGLNATPGRPAHPWSLAAAREFGVNLEHHGARLLTPDMVNQADVVFAMDYQNLVELHCRYPHAKHKFFMLSGYAGNGYVSSEIRDPYYGDEQQTRSCYSILQTCIENLVAALAKEAAQDASDANGTSTGAVVRNVASS